MSDLIEAAWTKWVHADVVRASAIDTPKGFAMKEEKNIRKTGLARAHAEKKKRKQFQNGSNS